MEQRFSTEITRNIVDGTLIEVQSAPPPPKSGLVTLWDLLKFNAHRFVSMLASSARFEGMRELGLPILSSAEFERAPFLEPFAKQIPEVLGKLKRECDESLLLSASDLVEEMLEKYKLSAGVITNAEYFRFNAELDKRIEHELKRKKFYQLARREPLSSMWKNLSGISWRRVFLARRMTSAKRADASPVIGTMLPSTTCHERWSLRCGVWRKPCM